MLEAGQTFAHFTIIRELGVGGMGAVYLAEDQKLHREVALKILLSDFFDDAERLARFQREAKTAAQISHPNVMAIYDIGSAPDPNTGNELQYIVMERVNGRPLSEYFQTTRPDMGAVIRIAGRIASGLAAAHKLSIAHRDIKSSNILVDEDGNPKILDFGLAKPIDQVLMGDEGGETDTISQELTRAGKILGTVSYMSPEQARGEPIDVRTDIFSFGVLLYRMATGEFPFSGKSQVSTLAKILESKHEPPRVKNESVPPELERIIDKCLQKDADDRYQTAADLVVDLRNLRRQYDSGVSDSVSGLTGRFEATRVFRISGRKLVTAVAAVVVLSIVSLLVLNMFDDQDSVAGRSSAAPAMENALAIFSFENKTSDASLDWLETGLPEILMTDLAQSGAITVISRDRVLDYLRSDPNMPDDFEKQMEEAQEAVREALAEEGVSEIPGVKAVMDAAKGRMENLRGQHGSGYNYSAMVQAAQSLGASNVLSGSFFKLGDRIRIDARLEDVRTGQIVLAEKVVGDDPFTLVDSLTAKIAQSLNIGGMESDQSVASVMTSSPEAYRLYHDGMEKFNLYLFDDAIELFDAALELDSTFALAYMRLGMANVFRGRQQEGAAYIALAEKYSAKLPVRERTLLDIYSDLWLQSEFDAAFVKLKSFVDNYPDYHEARAIYGLTLFVFNKDTVGAKAQYRAVLKADPTSQFALLWLADLYQSLQQYDSAVYYYKKVKTYHPESPQGYANLAQTYELQGRLDESMQEYRLEAELFPELGTPWRNLSDLAIRSRQFERAASYLEEYHERISDDPYQVITYYNRRANLAWWQGKFMKALDYAHEGLAAAEATGDSTRVSNVSTTLCDYYQFLDRKDSALHFVRMADVWSSGFAGLGLPLDYVETDRSLCDTLRPVLAERISRAKERLPGGVWPLLDLIETSYEAQCAADTAAIIDAVMALAEAAQPGQGEGNRRAAGVLMVESGRYREGRDILVDFLSGQNETTSGLIYPYTLYLVGKAEQELGNHDEAAARFEEMLRYWGDPDIEIKQIKDARRRLAQLTS